MAPIRNLRRELLLLLVAAAGYAGLMLLALRMVEEEVRIGPFWPAAGFALAMRLLFGPRVLVGVFLASVGFSLESGHGLLSLPISLTNVFEPWLAGRLLQRLRLSLERPGPKDVLGFASVTIGVCGAHALMMAVFGPSLGLDAPGSFGDRIRIWWISDALGMLVATPAVLALRPFRRRPTGPRIAEAALLATLLLGVGAIVFGSRVGSRWSAYSHEFLLYPFLGWAALRFGTRGAGLASGTLALVAFMSTVEGRGPFAAQEISRGVLGLGLFVGVGALASLFLASVDEGRRRAMDGGELLASIIRSDRAGICLVGLEPGLPIIFANDSLRRILCPDIPAPEGAQLRQLLQGRIAPESLAEILEAVRVGRALCTEARLDRPDGVRLSLDVRVFRVRGSDSRSTEVALSFSDLTEQKEMQARMALSERMASLGTLAAGVAHEINNPLAFISASLEFLSASNCGRNADAEERAALEDALLGTQRIRAIVSDLRVFSHAADVRVGPISLDEPIDLAVRMSLPSIRTRAEFAEDRRPMPPVVADPGRISQVVVNLLVNAAQAIPPEAPVRRIVLRTGTADDGRAFVEVSDTGVGMEPEVAARIFEPFFTTRGVGAGTGLGLSVAHGIVTSCGGELEVRSRPGVGTAMRVLLPAAEADERVAAAVPHAGV